MIFALIIIGVIIKNVALTANIRMVDHLEATGEKVSWRQGLRWGWSRSAFRLWLIKLVVGIPVAIVVLILLGCAAIPVLLGIGGGSDASTGIGIVATIAIGLLVVLLIVILAVIVTLWLRFVYRVCVLQNEGVMDSSGSGWQLLRRQWKEIGLMWLILTGVRIAVSIVLIPLILVLLVIAGIFGGGLGLLLYAISNQMIATAIIVGVLLFLLVFSLPALFVKGLSETYFETAWTLTYRETQAPAELIEAAPLV